MPWFAPLPPLVLLPAFTGQCDIVLLVLLRTAAKQNDYSFAVFPEVHPVSNSVSGAEVDPAFKDPAADALHIREVSQSQLVEGSGNPARRLGVEPVKPDAEEIAPIRPEIFPDFDHLPNGSIYCPIIKKVILLDSVRQFAVQWKA
jgi:hypothetical protein